MIRFTRPYHTERCFLPTIFHKLRDKISVQTCSVPVFWKSWKENEIERMVSSVLKIREISFEESTTFASREILIDVRSADWPCIVRIT